MRIFLALTVLILFITSCTKKSSPAPLVQKTIATSEPVKLQPAVFIPHNDTFYGTLRHTYYYYHGPFRDTMIYMYVQHPYPDSMKISCFIEDQVPLTIWYSVCMPTNDSGIYIVLPSSFRFRHDSFFYNFQYERCPDYEFYDYAGQRTNKPIRQRW